MKKSLFILSMSLAAMPAFAESALDSVACMGRVAPAERIAKLTAASPTGAQPVVKTLFVKKGDFVESGAKVAEMAGIDKAKASLERAEAVLAAVKSASAIRVQQQKNLVDDLGGSFAQNKKILDEKDPPRREREHGNTKTAGCLSSLPSDGAGGA